jgi:hypothetical protein
MQPGRPGRHPEGDGIGYQLGQCGAGGGGEHFGRPVNVGVEHDTDLLLDGRHTPIMARMTTKQLTRAELHKAVKLHNHLFNTRRITRGEWEIGRIALAAQLERFGVTLNPFFMGRAK